MSDTARPLLVVLGGLPGVGKTTLARHLAPPLCAVHLRIDTIEQAIRDARGRAAMDDAGYRVACALAEDNLRLGLSVIADSVNPLPLTRAAWRAAGHAAGARVVEVEITCSDPADHRHRIETRRSDIPGLQMPTWSMVCARDYRPWRPDLVVDTAAQPVEDCAARILAAVRRYGV